MSDELEATWEMRDRARAIREAGGLAEALAAGTLSVVDHAEGDGVVVGRTLEVAVPRGTKNTVARAIRIE